MIVLLFYVCYSLCIIQVMKQCGKNIWKQISLVTSLSYSAFEPTAQLPQSSSCGLLKSHLHLCSGQSRELPTTCTAPEQRAADVTICHTSVRCLKQMQVSAPDKPTRSALIKENWMSSTAGITVEHLCHCFGPCWVRNCNLCEGNSF